MPYHLCNHIYCAQFQGEMILLDTLQDKYMVLFNESSDLLNNLLENSGKEKSYKKNEFYIQKLLEDKIIEKKNTNYPFYIDKKDTSKGAPNVDWRLSLQAKKVKFNIGILKAFFTLTKVHLFIKTRGFYSILQHIKNSRKPRLEHITPEETNLNELAETLNKACLIFPIRTKCLEWAIAFVLLALERGWRCNLEIGVQNYPFVAHAWVECDGKVIMDSQDLRKGMAIIVNEPFRRLKHDLSRPNSV